MPLGPVRTYTLDKLQPAHPTEVSERQVAFAPNTYYPKGTIVGQISTSSVNDVQTIHNAAVATGGSFTLTIPTVDNIGTVTSPALAWNISNADLQTAITNLYLAAGYPDTSVITITNGPMASADVTVTFSGGLANTPLTAMTIALSLTGSTPSYTIVHTTTGAYQNSFRAYASGHSDGSQTARGICVYDFRTDEAGRVIYGGANTVPEFGERYLTAPIYVKGRFYISDLTGLDSTAVGQLGRLETGTLAQNIGVLALI